MNYSTLILQNLAFRRVIRRLKFLKIAELEQVMPSGNL